MMWNSPSVYCDYILLPLVNKEAALAYGRAEYSKKGNPRRGGKKSESVWCHVAPEEARGNKPGASWQNVK